MTPEASGPHAYFSGLAAHPACARAYSLRSQSQIEAYRKGLSKPSMVTYDPENDIDPRAQDAAKVMIAADRNSLETQVRLPTLQPAHTSLAITWEAWLGAEFAYENTGIRNYKYFQHGSPQESIYTEVRTRFSLAQSRPDAVALTDVRQYSEGLLQDLGSNIQGNPVVDGIDYGSGAMAPMVDEFAVRPEVWTRYWTLFELQEDGEWYRFSMWLADAEQGVVQVIDGVQLRPRVQGDGEKIISMDGSWDTLWLEYNTSTNEVAPGRGPLVAYARNVVMLHGLDRVAFQDLISAPTE